MDICKKTMEREQGNTGFGRLISPRADISVTMKKIQSSNRPPLFNLSRDIECSFGSRAASSACGELFLNRYDAGDVMDMLDGAGLTAHLQGKGFKGVAVDIDRDDAGMHHLRIYGDFIDRKNLLITLRVSEMSYTLDRAALIGGRGSVPLHLFVLEWLQSGNPRVKFGADDVPLPGQEMPPLGAVPYLMELLGYFSMMERMDGVMDTPAHLHGAIMYSRYFLFTDPVHEGILRAIQRDLGRHGLCDMSWGMATGTIIERNSGRPQRFNPSPQIYPLSSLSKRYFLSLRYRRRVRDIMKKKKYVLNESVMTQKRADILLKRKK